MDCKPSSNYDDLVRQFRASINVINGLERMHQYQWETIKPYIASYNAVESERQANDILTKENQQLLLILENMISQLRKNDPSQKIKNVLNEAEYRLDALYADEVKFDTPPFYINIRHNQFIGGRNV